MELKAQKHLRKTEVWNVKSSSTEEGITTHQSDHVLVDGWCSGLRIQGDVTSIHPKKAYDVGRQHYKEKQSLKQTLYKPVSRTKRLF